MKSRSEMVAMEIMKRRRKEENAEYWCSFCYDGRNQGDLLVCNHEECLKAYHPGCVYEYDPSVHGRTRTWTCDAHSCFICHQDRSYYCAGCPKALCTSCIGRTDFVQIEGQIGFCSVCLQNALLAEENKDADFDMHFMDHFLWAWKSINKRGRVTLESLRSAEKRMKTGKFYISGSDSDEGDEDIERCTGKAPMVKRKKLSHGKEIVGWGSRALIDFLKSLDIDVSQALPQKVVSAHIKDYILAKKLFHPDTKGLIICDTKLQTVLRRKEVKEGEILKYLNHHFSENQQSLENDETRFSLKEKQKEMKGNQEVMHSRDSSERNESIRICPVNEDGIGLEEIERSAAKVAEGPDNPDNLRKHAEQFQRQTPCASAEAGVAATPEDADNDDGKASKVFPGNQELMDQSASSNGSESIKIGPLNDDRTELERTERFTVNITEGDQEIMHQNASFGRHESIRNGPILNDYGTETAEKTEMSTAKGIEGNKAVEDNGPPLDEQLEAILRNLPEPDVAMQHEDPKSHVFSVRDSQLIILAKKLGWR